MYYIAYVNVHESKHSTQMRLLSIFYRTQLYIHPNFFFQSKLATQTNLMTIGIFQIIFFFSMQFRQIHTLQVLYIEPSILTDR